MRIFLNLYLKISISILIIGFDKFQYKMVINQVKLDNLAFLKI